MSITARQIGHDSRVGSPASNFVTISFTPNANERLMLAVQLSGASITSCTGMGLTWTQVATQSHSPSGESIVLMTAVAGSSPSAGAITLNFSGSVFEVIVTLSGYVGTSGLGTPVSSSAQTTPSVTLAALASTESIAYSCIGGGFGGGFAQGSGFTLLDSYHPDESIGAEYKLNTTAVTWAFPTNVNNGLIGVEIMAAADIAITVGLAETTATALPVTVSIGETPSSFTGQEARIELGCGEYRILLTERGGGHPIAFLPFSNLNWGRVVDDASSASFTVPIGEGDAFETCCRIFEENDSFDGEVDSWSHEIAVLRNDKQVWVGPIVDMTFSFTDIQIQCRDLFAWFDVRLLPKSRDEIGDLAALFQLFAKDALDLEPSPNITISPWAINTINRFTVLVQDYIVAGNVLREIGKDGVDFTMVGRTLYEGNLDGVATDLGIALQLPQQAVMEGTLQKRGSELATQLTLTGRPPGGSTSTIHATAGGKSDKYGLVQRQQAESFITVPAFLQDAANSRYAHIKTPPRYLDITLDPKAPFLMEQLIAGFLVDVKCRVGCASVIEMMRLHSLNVTVGMDDAGTVTETIQASIVPQGQPTFGFDLGFGGDN